MSKVIKPNLGQAVVIFFKMLIKFDYENGIITKNKKGLNVSEICEQLSYSSSYFNDVLNLLEDANICSRLPVSNYKIISINPSLIDVIYQLKGGVENESSNSYTY